MKLNEEARKLLLQKMNKMIVDNKTVEGRQTLIDAFTLLLIACEAYRGFNYLYWMEKGFLEWREAGSPRDNTKFLGDQTMIRFY